MAKLQYTPEQIEEHLGYEIDMLNEAYGFVRCGLQVQNVSQLKLKRLRYMFLEDFCIHARLLLEFFETKAEKNPNAAANSCKAFIPKKSPKWMTRKLNNQIAHLMEGRTADSNEKIDNASGDKIIQEIAKYRDAFVADLNSDHLHIKIPAVAGVIDYTSTISADGTTSSSIVHTTSVAGALSSPMAITLTISPVGWKETPETGPTGSSSS